MLNEFLNYLAQRAFPKQDHLIQARFPDATNEPFGISVQVWGAWRELDRLHAGVGQHAARLKEEQSGFGYIDLAITGAQMGQPRNGTPLVVQVLTASPN